jgi:hypothetical protein
VLEEGMALRDALAAADVEALAPVDSEAVGAGDAEGGTDADTLAGIVPLALAAAVLDADTPFVVLAVGAGDGEAVAGESVKTVLGDAMERSSHAPRRSYGQNRAGESLAADAATVDMPSTRCTVSAAVSTA